MSEVAPKPSHEKHEVKEHVEHTSEALKNHVEAMREHAETDNISDAELESIKANVADNAVSKEDYNSSESSADSAPTATYVSRELKEMGLRRNLNNVRRQLNAPSRALSKAIHQPVVEKISEVVGPTVARPSGILGGGLFAVIGSAILLYISKHYGYRYNYLVFIFLFIGGFVAGMIVELIIRALVGRKKAI